MRGKQAVIETDMGSIVIDLLPEAAPNHVGYFIKNAQDGLYNGTIFHRVVRQGIIQGGDPLTKDPVKAESMAPAGFGVLKAERNAEKNTRGAVSAVAGTNNPDSGGTQFFICVSDQPALDGVLMCLDASARAFWSRRKFRRVRRTTSADGQKTRGHQIGRDQRQAGCRPEPFSPRARQSSARTAPWSRRRMGNITLEFTPDKAPEHVRNFLRLAQAGVYDGMAFHRVAKGFVIQSGYLPSRRQPLSESQQRIVRTLQPEFNDTLHIRGTISMARGDNPASADTSFFIVLGPSPILDGKYTAFGRVVDGLNVVDAIEQVPVNGEAPQTRVEVKQIRVEKR